MSRAHRWGSIAGAIAALVVFSWVLFAGQATLSEPRPTTDFYDLQARAWFDGRWDVPEQALSIEAFVIDDKAYLYFGPVPSVLRVPVLALTDRFDGRLSQVSMLGAFALLLAAVSRLWWRVSSLAGVTHGSWRAEALVAGAVVCTVGAGSTVVVLAAAPIVYHEAILWGVAFALSSFGAQVTYLACGRTRHLAAAGGFATAAVLTRASVGLGPVASLAAISVVSFVAVTYRRRREREATPRPWDATVAAARWCAPGIATPGRRRLAVGVLAAVLPVVAYASVNLIKFDHPYQLPLDAQVFSEFDPARQAALDANDGSLFGVQFVPTTLWHYVRPDAVQFQPVVPWVVLPRTPGPVLGDVTFDTVESTTSVTVAMPVFVVLGLIGLLALARTSPERPLLGALRLPVLGAAVGFVGVLTIAYVANRYLGDALPLLVLCALAGLARVSWSPHRRPVAALLGVLAVWGAVVNVGIAVETQRLAMPGSSEQRYAFVVRQYGGDATYRVRQVDVLDPPPARGALAVMGECQALVWSDGASWVVLEGEVPAEAVPDKADAGPLTPEPVLVDSAVRTTTLCASLLDRLDR